MTEPPIDAVRHDAPGSDVRRILLVALPGYGMVHDDFARHGFIAAVHDRGWPVDIIAARPDLGLYLDGTVATRLHAEIIQPARCGAGRLWLLGVSLGAMGALLYAQHHPGVAAGAILLAPFIGTPGLIAEVAEAGGLARWEAGEIRVVDIERQLLSWLKPRRAGVAGGLPLYLGYGRGDRFARAASLLAQELPAARVVVDEGGHDWDTWRRLWREVLERDPFAAAKRERSDDHG